MDALAETYGSGIAKAAAGVVQLNGTLGRVCFGPDEGSRPTYAAVENWLGRKVRLSKKPDHVELARRYLQGYGPAAPRDLAAWWGLGLTEAKAAWAALDEELVELDAEGRTVWRLRSERANPAGHGPAVRLLPAFDTYLLGYHDRSFAVAATDRGRIFHGGEIVPVILVDGLAAGTWRYAPRGKGLGITAAPFGRLASSVRDLIAEEAEDIGRFLGLKTTLSFHPGS
jgi:hypothetical protein